MNLKEDRKIEAIIFDLDDTLYSEKDYVKSGFCAVAKIVPDIKDFDKKLWHAFENQKPAIDAVLKTEGIYTEELKNQCMQKYRYHNPDIKMYDGVESLLKLLRENKIKTGIITDGRPEGQRAKIKSLGLDLLVDYIIITDELGGIEYRKPNELAFRLMKEKIGVPYEKMVYVGDNPKKDFDAPKKLGMNAWCFMNGDGLYHSTSFAFDKDIKYIQSIEELIKMCNAIMELGEMK